MAYNYNDFPSLHDFKKKSNMFESLYRIEDNMIRVNGILLSGSETCGGKNQDMRRGNVTSFESGICGYESDKECIGKVRNIVVNNIPPNVKGNNGLIPSLINDIQVLNPTELVKNLTGMGRVVNNNCKLKKVEIIELNNPTTSIKEVVMCVPKDTTGATVESFQGKTFPRKRCLRETSRVMQLCILTILCIFILYIIKCIVR